MFPVCLSGKSSVAISEESGCCGKTITLCATNITQSIKKSVKKHE
jgi:hypothetical protein